ncbi:cysteine desulfurase family protein [Thiovibrio frasassiensis]|uniref:cysteine desulfurase n=1 Tax=Thiovibrio frasassiensis TaxID=2984131 RepID=A0A9X4RM62_9BACT|nr:aminotransferase class V-fold PLP-dependent enzyme [Thiovibrio frasassiensis]MDG4475853.1 cysteine desulfurase [Thiovibrio frasassiensis]
MHTIYFDNNASTPLDPAVRAAMAPYLADCFGNPASSHRFGEAARHAVELAREQVAGLLGCHPGRIVLNSGGTEGNNTAIFSAIWGNPGKKHIISSQVEHGSVLAPLEFLASQGYEVELLGVDENGTLDLDALKGAIRPDTGLVSLMVANNETGVLWPMAEIAAICRARGVLLHCDAIQLAGKAALSAEALGVDYLTIAGHKLHGPKGVGALYVSRTAPFTPLIMGTGQENGRRSGTENVPGIVGFGQACALAAGVDEAAHRRLAALRDLLEAGIVAAIPEVRINGALSPRLVNTTNVSFRHAASAGLIQDLDAGGIAVSAHAACQTGDVDPSHVLRAMRVPEPYLHGTLRISLSRYNTADEVAALLTLLPNAVAKARQGFAL